jgi:hypothetical protein
MADVFETYQALNRLYLALQLNAKPTTAHHEILNALLTTLRDLNDDIANTSSGPFDQGRKELDLKRRAAAWLLGWAVFSRIVISFSRENGDQNFRQHLILLTDSSTLGLLLEIYRQLKEAEPDTSEPLRRRLPDRLNIPAFAYMEKVEGSSEGYIPSAAEIVGKSDDDPGGRRNLLSLWGLVNLQLDTWYASAPEFQPAGCRIKKVTGSDGTLGLGGLTAWLDDFNRDTHLSSFGQTDGFRLPLAKIVKFLQFRERYANAIELRALCDDVRTKRVNGNLDILETLRPLVDAATPTENKEQLYDAAIWLRYVLLLSFDRERSVITDDAAANNLEKTWAKFFPGEPYTPAISPSTARKTSSCAPFLRWNAAPYNGHVSAVIGDLIDATYKYLSSERGIQKLEGIRFQTVGSIDLKVIGKDYAKKLNTTLGQLNRDFEERVQPYFPPRQDVATIAGYDPSDWDNPAEITLPESEKGIVFHTSTAPSERERLALDLATIATEIKSTEAKYSLIRQVYDQVGSPNVDLPATTRTLQSLGGLTALSNWNLYRLPSMNLDRYQFEFKKQIEKLRGEVDTVLVKRDVRGLFQLKRKEVEQDYLTLLAAKLGLEVAERAIKISKIYEGISELGIQIADLEAKAFRLDNEGWMNEKQKAWAELAYRRRIRDLGAARVEALIEASKEAEELVKSAEEELGAMAQQLQAAARNIEDNNSSSAILGIVKLVVTVVGAALAPFTGGASIAVATLVNKGIDIYDQITRMKWGGLNQTLANLEKISGALAEGISFAVENFGSDALKQDLHKVSAFLKSSREKINQVVKDLESAGKKLGIELKENLTVSTIISAVQKFEKDHDVLNFAAAVANGYTITVLDTTVRLDFSGKKISFTNERLRKDLQDLFAAGHIIINDAAARAEGLTNLAALPDAELRQKLYASFKGVVGQLPPELLDRLRLNADEAKKKAEQVLERMKDNIEKGLNPEDLRLFAQILAAGCLFVKDGDLVVAVEPPPFTEAEKFKRRLELYKEKIQSDVLLEEVKFWSNRKEELIAKAQELSAQGDDQGMRNFANDLHNEITKDGGLQSRLRAIQGEIENAKGELEDKTTETEIADYDAKANELFAQANEVRVQQADVSATQSKLRMQAALEFYLSTLTEKELASTLVQAELRRIESGELALIQAYEKCLAMGFNPLALTSDFNSYGAVSIRRVLANFVDLEQPLDGAFAGAAGSHLVGMIQWARLLGVGSSDPKTDPAGQYIKLVNGLNVGTPTGDPKMLASTLVAIQEAVESSITGLNLGSELAQMDETGPVPFEKIFWLDRPDLTDEQKRSDLAPLMLAERKALLAEVKEEYRNQVIGILRVVVDSASAPDPDEESIKLTRPVKNKMFYTDIDSISPIAKKGANLSYLVVPPVNAQSHPGVLAVGGAVANDDPDNIPFDWNAIEFEDRYREKLGTIIRGLRLTGALGHWTIFILTSSDSSPSQRLAKVRQLKATKFEIDTLPMIFIQIPVTK